MPDTARQDWQIIEDLERCAKEPEAPPSIAALLIEAAAALSAKRHQSNVVHEFIRDMTQLTGYKLIRPEQKRKDK